MSRFYEVQFGSHVETEGRARPGTGRLAVVLVALALPAMAFAIGCGGGGAAGGGGGGGGTAVVDGNVVTTAGGDAVSAAAHSHWQDGLTAFTQAESAGWNEARCESVLEQFEEANDAQG